MTSPESPVATLRKIVKTYFIPYLVLYRDSKEFDPSGRGVSESTFYKIVNYGYDPLPKTRSYQVITKLIEALKQKYPSEPKEVLQKR